MHDTEEVSNLYILECNIVTFLFLLSFFVFVFRAVAAIFIAATTILILPLLYSIPKTQTTPSRSLFLLFFY